MWANTFSLVLYLESFILRNEITWMITENCNSVMSDRLELFPYPWRKLRSGLCAIDDDTDKQIQFKINYSFVIQW